MDITELYKDMEFVIMHAEMEGETCGLKHSKFDPAENHEAVDCLCQQLGDQNNKIAQQEIRIPICKECSEALQDEDWILMYCVFCFKSQWIYRPRAKFNYPKGNLVYFIDVCPFCAEIADEMNKNM